MYSERRKKLLVINPHDRNMRRSGVRSAMVAASQLSLRGPTDGNVAPVPVIKNLIKMMIYVGNRMQINPNVYLH